MPINPRSAPRAPFHRLAVAAACVGAAVALAAGAAMSTAHWDAAAPAPVHAPVSITSPRLCAAAVVYHLASSDDWGLRTTIAQTALNAFDAAGTVPDCAGAVSDALTEDFSVRRWQGALDAVDAVRTGAYTPSPAACARANAIVPATADSWPVALASATQCVIAGLAFVQVQP